MEVPSHYNSRQSDLNIMNQGVHGIPDHQGGSQEAGCIDFASPCHNDASSDTSSSPYHAHTFCSGMGIC